MARRFTRQVQTGDARSFALRHAVRQASAKMSAWTDALTRKANKEQPRPNAAAADIRARLNETVAERFVNPFTTDVPICSYLNLAFPLSIVARNPKHRIALLGSFIQLFFPDKKLDYDCVLMLPSLRARDWSALGFLDMSVVDTHSAELRRPDALVGFLIERLHRGQYADMQIDEYFIPGRPGFGNIHSVHDNLIFGYDLTKRLFHIAGYDKVYEVSSASFEDISKAFYEMPRNFFKKRYLAMLKLRDDAAAEVELASITSQLSDYVDSKPTLSPSAMRKANLYWKARRFTGVWGLDTYEAFIDHVTTRGRERKPLDLRATRTLWEHKACMLGRLKFLEEAGYLRERGMAEAYAPVEEIAKAVRFDAYEYNTMGQEQALIEAIVSSLREMRLLEGGVLRRVRTALAKSCK